MTESEANECITMLVDGLPWVFAKWSSDQIRRTFKVYRTGILDLELADAKAAVLRLLLTARMMPSIADIRAAAANVYHGEVTTGAEAWGVVRRLMKSKGSHRTPGIDFTIDDPISRQVVADFGWSDLCSGTLGESTRARFIDAYEAIQRRERTRAQLSPGAKNPQLPAARDREQRQLGDVMQKLLPATTNERSPQ